MTQLFLFTPFLWLPILWWIGGTIVSALIGGIIYALCAKDAIRIGIFGSKGAGKTTMWKQLRGEFENGPYITTPGKNAISEFTIEYGDVKKTIEKSADFGGDDELVHRYGEIIENGTFIYYLINLTTLKEKKYETRARLKAICKDIKERELEVGLQVVGTHYEEFQKTTGLSKEEAKKRLVDSLGFGSIKDVKINDKIIIAELTDRNDISQFVKQIIGVE